MNQLFLYYIIYIRICNSQLTNQWIEQRAPSEDIWRSTSDFIPTPSQSFGHLRLGQIMSMEFDFVWHGRTNNPRTGVFENFFRIGFTAANGNNCNGEGSRYPSFWLSDVANTMHVSVSADTTCQPHQSLSAYGNITVETSYHIKIAFNNTHLVVEVSGAAKPSWNKSWTREPTQSMYLGQNVSVWWMSDNFDDPPFNTGNGTFSNITIISKIFPTSAPTTHSPTVSTMTPTYNPSKTPTQNPSITPTMYPTQTPYISPSSTEPTPNPVYGELYECRHGEDCNVYCLHPNDCYLTHILCPITNNECNVYCTQYSCIQISLSAQFVGGGVINIECNGIESCKGAVIDSAQSTNTTLNIQISDTHSLQNSMIYCPDQHCNISSMHNSASFEGLINSKVIAKSDTKLLLLQVNGDGIVKNATIQCPQKQSQQTNICQIIVGNDNIMYTDMLSNTIIKAQGGLHEVDIICDNNNNAVQPQIQCGTDYESSCEIQRVSTDNDTYWQCNRDAITWDFLCDNTDYIDLICVITGGDTTFIDKQVQTIESLAILLDGDAYTYDPWLNTLDKSHLLFQWSCQYHTASSSLWRDCNEMFVGLDEEATTYAQFETQHIIENEDYVYQYTLDVTDINNGQRLCQSTPTITISIHTRPNEEDNVLYIPLLTVSIQPLDSSEKIYIDTPVRLIGKLSTWDGTDTGAYYYKYIWSDISGQISAEQLWLIANSIHEKNLIIDSYALLEGYEYEFELTVQQYADSMYDIYLQTVTSQSIIIYVNAPDISVINSTIMINEDCIANAVTYTTFEQLFSRHFNITFNGKDAESNGYQFAYSMANYINEEKILLHPSLLTSQTYFNDFILPLSSSIIFHVDIFDQHYKSVEINTNEFCMIGFASNVFNKCISYKHDVYNELQSSKLFIIQTAHSILHLVHTQSTGIDDCKQEYMTDLLDVIYTEFVALCQSDFVLQLAQVLTNWIRITVSSSEFDIYLSSAMYLEQIYNLSVVILDPCLSFIDISEQELEACSDSVITSQSAVCLKGTNAALSLSTLFATDRYSYIFLSFIESLISVLDETSSKVSNSDTHFSFSMDLFSLIRKSLYIYQLLGLSVSIPYELTLYDSDTFQLCSYRTLNTDVKCNGTDISVLLTSNNTQNGRHTLNDIDPDLNAADISVIFLYTNKSQAFVVDPCTHKKEKNELQGKSATIMLSSDSNTNNLTSNINITFNEADNRDKIQCVWYNEEDGIWDTFGCDTFIDNDAGQIVCSCSHLTTFSTIKFLYNDCLSHDKYSNLSYSDFPILSNLIFLMLFFILFLKITSDLILIFDGGFWKRLKIHYKDGAFNGPGTVYICTFFELLLCVEFHFAFMDNSNENNTNVIILTLLFPLLTFCWMFFGVLRTWIRITYSFNNDTITIQRFEKGMRYFIILFLLFIIIETILIFSRHNYYIYGEIIWCIIMSIFTVGYVIYATSAIKVIWKSVTAVQNDIVCKEQNEDSKLLRKLLTVSVLLAVYFVVKTTLSIYLSIHVQLNHDIKYSFMWRVIDMGLEFFSLCIIYHLYSGGTKRLINSYNNKPVWIKCYKKCKTLPCITNRIAVKQHIQNNNNLRDNTKSRKSHAFVVQSRGEYNNIRVMQPEDINTNKNSNMPKYNPQMRHLPSSSDICTEMAHNRISTTGTSNYRSIASPSPSLTFVKKERKSLSTLPNLSQLESVDNNNANQNDHPPYHKHSIFNRFESHSTSTAEPSLYEQFSNAARTRFPSRRLSVDTPLPEVSGHYEDNDDEQSSTDHNTNAIIPGKYID